MPKPVYRRVLLKLSGEALGGNNGDFGIHPKTIDGIAAEIASVSSMGVELGIVIGGGNIFRGIVGASQGMDKASADYMGMIATVINSLAFQDALEKYGIATRVMSAITMREVAEPYIRRRAIRHLEKKRVVIFAAGTGNPYFTTDTAAALRGMEINAEVILKATKVNGVYDKDPVKYQDAEKFDLLSYSEVLAKDLKVMDATAISLAMDNKMPIIIFNIKTPGNIKRVMIGESIGTRVKG